MELGEISRMWVRYREASVGVGQDAGGVISPSSSVDALIPSGSSGGGGSSGSSRGPSSVDESPLPVVRLKGVELHAITERQCIHHILNSIAEGKGGTVVTPNLDIIRRCTRDLGFATLVSESDLVVPDGMPLILASKIQGTPLPARIAGSDLISSLSAAAADAGRSIFLLGGSPGSAEGAAKVLQARSPKLVVAGTYCPSMGFQDKPDEMAALIAQIVDAKPDIVWVALGSPKQELLINRIRDSLPGAWWLGIGISFSFLTGEVQRAPRWVQILCLEWLHRVWQEPGRLFKRYFVHGLPFAASLVGSAMRHRLFSAVDESTIGHRFRGRRVKRPASRPGMIAALTRMPEPEHEPEPEPPAVSVGIDVDRPADPFAVPRMELTAGRGLKRLKAIILLGGKVRQSSFGASLNRSVLDLPLDDSGTILNHWVTQSNELAKRFGLDGLIVRVMVDQKGHEPTSIPPQFAHMVRVERDRSSFRGTGGLIADIAADYADDDLILVANASQVLLDPLSAIAQTLDHKTGDFTLISHRDGTASGIMLLACKTVRSINPVGYIDLKEQALPSIAKLHDVRVVHCRQPTGLPLFSLADYISALQQHHRRRSSRRARTNPLGEEFGKHFAIVEPGANVAPDAYLHDAVVLSGATVESGASAIRSLVLPGASLRRTRQISDALVDF